MLSAPIWQMSKSRFSVFSPEAALRQVLTLLQATTPGNAAEEVGSRTGEGRASRGRVFSELSLWVLEDPVDPQGWFPLAVTASCPCRGEGVRQ